MKVFNTYLYEVSKGTKPMALVTCEAGLLEKILSKLKKESIPYCVQNLPNSKINIFFGKKACVDVVEKFLDKPLDKLSLYEDFILGTLLGYDIILQCKRLLERDNILKHTKIA